MEQIVSRIIEVEQRAQQVMNEARKMRDELSQSISEDVEKMKEKYTVRAENRIEIVRLEEQKYLNEVIKEIESIKEKEQTAMEEKYQNRQKEWVDTLFFRIIGGD